MDLQRLVAGTARQFSGVQLRDRGLLGKRPSAVLQPRGLVYQSAGGLDLGRHVGQLELHRLEAADGAAELLALLGVAETQLERALCHAEPQRGDADAAAIQDLEELLEAVAARAEQVFLSHPAAVERQLTGIGRSPAHLLERR